MPNELVKPEQTQWEIMEKQADALVKSGMLPSHWNSREKVLTAGVFAQALGVHPMTIIQNCYVLDGKVGMSVNLMLGLAYARVPGVKIEYKDVSDEGATCIGQKPGGEPFEYRFTLKDAAKARLTGKFNWQAYPREMCMARATSAVVRKVAPEAFLGVGVYTPEELGEDKVKHADAKVLTPEDMGKPPFELDAEKKAAEKTDKPFIDDPDWPKHDDKDAGASPKESAQAAPPTTPPIADAKQPVAQADAPDTPKKPKRKAEAELTEEEITADNKAGKELQPKLWELCKYLAGKKGWKEKDVLITASSWTDVAGRQYAASSPDDFWKKLKRGADTLMHCRIAWMRTAYGKLKEMCEREGLELPACIAK